MTLTLEQHPLAVHGQCMDPTGTLVCRMHETHDGWQPSRSEDNAVITSTFTTNLTTAYQDLCSVLSYRMDQSAGVPARQKLGHGMTQTHGVVLSTVPA